MATVIRRFVGTAGAWAIIFGCSTVIALSVIGVPQPWPALLGSMIVIQFSKPWRGFSTVDGVRDRFGCEYGSGCRQSEVRRSGACVT
jgi:hypothetical protein